MKKLICILLLCVSCLSAWACDATKAAGGGLVLELQPGVPQVVEWDMTDCLFGIQNWTVYLTQPRPCPSCLQKELRHNTPLSMELINMTTGVPAPGAEFVRYGGTVSMSLMRLTLMLSPQSKKPLAVEVSTTGAFGGLF